ncbi:hypothetical protein M0804_000653 [Polistes exclamans]|nr:hypothetical protein M0804_000653 [Polistes exclamans]
MPDLSSISHFPLKTSFFIDYNAYLMVNKYDSYHVFIYFLGHICNSSGSRNMVITNLILLPNLVLYALRVFKDIGAQDLRCSTIYYFLSAYCGLCTALNQMNHYNFRSNDPSSKSHALFINVLSIFFDIVTLSVYFPIGLAYASEKFSAAFMIINLIVRVVTSIYLLRIGQARGGSLATMFTSCPPMGIARQDYEDISHSIPQNSDFVGI